MNLKQLIALIRLRLRLSLNQIKKGGQLNTVLYSIVAVGIFLFAISSFFGAFAMGVILLPDRPPRQVMFIWNLVTAGFLVMWSFHVMNRIQQNDAISVDKLLHLPMTFRGAFFLNYLSTFGNMTLLTLAPTMIGLALAMPIARGVASAIAIPLTLSFLFMVTAVTWYFRAWLAEKMENKRTRGLLMAVLPLLFVGLFVGFVEFTDSKLSSLLKDVPLGWLPSGVEAAESGDWSAGVIGSCAMTAIGFGCLLFAFNSSLRKFTGATSSGKESRASNKSVQWSESSMFSSFPGVSAPVSGIAMGTIYSLRRAPEVFAALVPVIVLAIFGSPYLIGMKNYVVSPRIVDILPIGLISVALLGFPAFLFSTFSYDRDGFRAFVLSPVERKDILFGKNLAIGIPTVILGWLTMVVLQCFFPVGAFWFLGAMVCLVPSFILLCILGNAISALSAVGLKRGSMTPVNAKVVPVIVLYLGVLAGPFVAMLPTAACFVIAKITEIMTAVPMGWLFILLSVVQLVVSWFAYRKSLSLLGPQLWKRESEILGVVANIPE